MFTVESKGPCTTSQNHEIENLPSNGIVKIKKVEAGKIEN